MPVDAPTGALRVLPMGEAALLVEVVDIDSVLDLHAVLASLVSAGEGVWAGVDELVAGARTLLLVTRPATDLDALSRALGGLPVPRQRHLRDAHQRGDGPVVEIPVDYSGADLAEVARLTGLTPTEVIAAHTGTPWRVGFGGFAPGFAYLVGGDPRLTVPRRTEPRTRVPAGSVGLAGEFSGIYPRSSPGGWQLIGTTKVALWDEQRDPPALLLPGTTVRFVAEGS
ncbi:5-oxoprolinase subunit B family protein [Janibacter sp. G1551]|uniref:5-oxoprolinase subunit B family protein n=1 Tax=Janibacter sp. G1551 TaxID=3420440 RepID=UPI003D000345